MFRSRLNNKRWLHVMLMLAATSLLSACSSESEHPKQAKEQATATPITTVAPTAKKEGWYQGKIKVGHLVALDMAPLFVAKEAGYFAEEGLDVETVFFANPGDNNAALAGNAIQFSVNPFTLPYFAQNSGIPMRIIASAGGLGVIQVIIQGQFGVNNPQELAQWVKAHPNKKLKVAALRGDTLEMILYRSFSKVGLTYDNFEMVWFNDLFSMVQAFESDQVDILSHIQPYTTRMELEKGAKLLTDSNKVWGYGTPNCTLDVMEDFLQKYPNTVHAYLRAVYRGFELIVNDPDKAVALVEKGKYYRVSSNVLKQAFLTQKKVELSPNRDGMMMAINDMIALGYIKKPKVDILRLDSLAKVTAEMQAGK